MTVTRPDTIFYIQTARYIEDRDLISVSNVHFDTFGSAVKYIERSNYKCKYDEQNNRWVCGERILTIGSMYRVE